MPLNVDAIKARLASLNKKGGSGTNSKAKEFIWKPAEGKQDIRIVPYQFQPDNPFIELKFHYDFMGKTYLSPSSFNKSDPIVELSDRLKKNGDKDDWRIGRDLEPKMRTFVPIIVRGKEAEGVKFWGFGVQVYKQLMAAMAEPDYGDITDLINGYDIRVEFVKKSGKKSPDGKQEFPETTIMIKPKQKPVIDPAMVDGRSVLEKITTKQTNILDIYTVATYEELAAALEEKVKKQNETKASADNTDDNVQVPTEAEIEAAAGPSDPIVEEKAEAPKAVEAPKIETPKPITTTSPSATLAGSNTAKLNSVFQELFKQTK
jgi:hypothetical protein